jgi:hypothetical protein
MRPGGTPESIASVTAQPERERPKYFPAPQYRRYGLGRSGLVSGLLSCVLVLVLALPAPALAREANFRRFTDYLWFALGAGIGLALHEGAHLLVDVATDAKPEIMPVSLGPFPFFAIGPTNIQTQQQRYAIAMAGFVMQDLYSETILQLDPRLREHDRPLLKGMLALHTLLTTGYAITGFAGVGPLQSDVNTLARALAIPPWAVGLLLISPALCDTYRYFVPGSRWAPWVSITGKLTLLGGVLTF